METLIAAYITVVLATASIMMAWFSSALAVHLTRFLDDIGLIRLPKGFIDILEDSPDKDGWDTAMAAYAYPMVAELLACPVCLSFHISCWVSVVVLLANMSLGLGFVALCTATVPAVANIIYKLVK